ncbi:PAX-interacting protein 1 [Quillaja saponaria]|uniref:PAX-interacting protein 1 n=1 Tax=Quillaja saponaria TaxID=32244 RepID=A0AAD7Q888_QUISA|nr:PAX-interacting protein 1 [Quillaja saponaria]
MAPKQTPSSPIPIGNCEVKIEAKSFTCKSDLNSLQISFSKTAKINISVMEDINTNNKNVSENSKSEGKEDDYLFVLVNPKDVDSISNSYLQEVLQMYMTELPAMNFAANTGKQSMFLKRCVKNGKYCTLLLQSKCAEVPGKVIAAITYQIIPADTQYVEIPLAAVSSIYQQKGFGHLLYIELRKRLQSVGVRTIFCWGDKESEGFWLKQGFVRVAEVDTKGRARSRRLPIKANICKALCFPGGSTLMVSHLSKDMLANAEGFTKCVPLTFQQNYLPSTSAKSERLVEFYNTASTVNRTMSSKGPEHSQPESLVKDRIAREDDKLDGLESRDSMHGHKDSSPFAREDNNRMGIVAELSKDGADVDLKHNPYFTQGAKRVWEASLSSLKSKKVKGTHLIDYAQVGKEMLSEKQFFRIMLMNIADESKMTHLIKVIEGLGGAVTSDGSITTHVITGKVRKTLNFCTALCSGAWVLSSSWLKESFREGKFVEELPYILNDEDYMVTYRTDLKGAVLKAKTKPRALLKGYKVCISAHVQPPAKTLSAIVTSAGGNVISGLDQVNEASKTIFVTCEEDIEEAMQAVKKGIWTFGSEWLMNCVMRQELDLDGPQFAESL